MPPPTPPAIPARLFGLLGELCRHRDKISRGLIRTCEKIKISEVPATVWDLNFVLSWETKALKAFWKFLGKNVDSSTGLLMDLIASCIDELPSFWCALINFYAMVDNLKIVYRWFCHMYTGNRVNQLAPMSVDRRSLCE